jgi:hypothetical protein
MQNTYWCTEHFTEITTDYCAVDYYRQQRVVLEMCAFLGYYAVYSGNFLPTFWYYLLVVFLRVKKSKKKIIILGFVDP